MYINVRINKHRLIAIALLIIFATGALIKVNNNSRAEVVSNSKEYIKVPIIMYHSVLRREKLRSKFIIRAQDFENDLKYLKNNGYTTIVMKDLINYIYEDKELPNKPIMLTFDDGYYNNYLYVFPLLKQYNSKIVLSPIGKQSDIYSELDDKNPTYAHCSWNNLKEMNDSGLVEIQNHSYNMHTITKSRRGTKKNKNESLDHYKKVFVEDTLLMHERFKKHLDRIPDTYVFPFGAITNCSIDIAKELGYKAVLNCEGKINKITKSPDGLYKLCRILRPPNISSESFFKNKIENVNT